MLARVDTCLDGRPLISFRPIPITVSIVVRVRVGLGIVLGLLLTFLIRRNGKLLGRALWSRGCRVQM